MAIQPNPQEGTPTPAANPTPENDKPLTNIQLLLWGGIGGALSVIVSNGLFDGNTIANMISGNAPAIQLTTLIVVGLLIACVGAIWAMAHRPITSVMVALQLGIIAPTAINAFYLQNTGGAAPSTASSANLMARQSLITPASWQPIVVSQKAGPSTTRCIMRALVRKPC